MKHILTAISISILLLAGCKASTSPTGTTTTPGSMIATVNGKAWSSTVLPGTGGATGKMNSNVLSIIGLSVTDNTEISLILPKPAVGTDSLGATGYEGDYSILLGATDTTIYGSIPEVLQGQIYDGAVSITSYDSVSKSISGTFHFIGRRSGNLSDSVTITNGSFYQVTW